MTALLEQALAEMQRLSAMQQDAIAALILEELADEARWDQTFAQSGDVLVRLAKQARAEKHAGNVVKIGFDAL